MSSFTIVDSPLRNATHVEALQHVSEACWSQRVLLLGSSAVRGAFLTISGGVLQVDIDKCAAACDRTRRGKKFFDYLLGDNARETLILCQAAYDAFFTETLAPAAKEIFPLELIHRMPGRKLLLSGAPGCAQLLHLDSLSPTLVGNVYLRPRGFEDVSMLSTIFPHEPKISQEMNYPRDLNSLAIQKAIDDALGCNSTPWKNRENIGPKCVKHNTAIIFHGNTVHGGPAPDKHIHAEPRIVMFQSVRPGSSKDEDLSDYQEFEFSMFNRMYGDCLSTRRAVRDTAGRWREHFSVDCEADCETVRVLEEMEKAPPITDPTGPTGLTGPDRADRA